MFLVSLNLSFEKSSNHERGYVMHASAVLLLVYGNLRIKVGHRSCRCIRVSHALLPAFHYGSGFRPEE